MRFLTLVRNSTSYRHAYTTLICAAVSFSIQLPAWAQMDTGSFEIKARTGVGNPSFNLESGALPWVIGLLCLVLFGIMLATLWPNESENNQYQRQRKFARIDGLFLKIAGLALDEEESRQALKHPAIFMEEQGRAFPPFGVLTLTSLSFGGCSIAATTKLKKGSIVLLHLHSLPDYPARALTVAAKIVWSRVDQGAAVGMEVAGAKFIYFSDGETPESLRKYLNYLMDEPIT